ncbi:hypothetical protein [Nostoc punctiforme]|uniref:hypothetical protein n=1 Tax=Nostoc punctiforme TaxID=272131 RepID=UPI0030EF6E37
MAIAPYSRAIASATNIVDTGTKLIKQHLPILFGFWGKGERGKGLNFPFPITL